MSVFWWILICCLISRTTSWDDRKERAFRPEFLFGASSLTLYTEGALDENAYYLTYQGQGRDTEEGRSRTWNYYQYSNKFTPLNLSGDFDLNRRLQEDVTSLRQLGVDFYRFSVSWTRIMPDGENISEDGLQLYDNLIDELLKYNIEPVICMHDFDVPPRIFNEGSWCNPEIVPRFKDYAKLLIRRYGDRVKKWTTINRPQGCYEVCRNNSVIPDMITGVDDYICIKNVLMAHAKVYRMYEAKYKKKFNGQIGFSLDINWIDPVKKEEPYEKATEIERQFRFDIFLHPIFSKFGDFPSDVKSIVDSRSRAEGLSNSRLPKLSKKEINMIKGAADYISVNHYTTSLISPDERKDRLKSVDHNIIESYGSDWVPSPNRWLYIVPYGMYKMCLYLNKMYDFPPILIAENGVVTPLGVNDSARVSYLKEYLQALLYAIEDGTELRGYSVFSLTDSAHGEIKERFGLYEIDSKDPKMTTVSPRDSAFFYKKVVATHKNHLYWKFKGQSRNMDVSSRRLEMMSLLDQWNTSKIIGKETVDSKIADNIHDKQVTKTCDDEITVDDSRMSKNNNKKEDPKSEFENNNEIKEKVSVNPKEEL